MCVNAKWVGKLIYDSFDYAWTSLNEIDNT